MKTPKKAEFEAAAAALPHLSQAIADAVKALRALDDHTSYLDSDLECDAARVLFIRASSTLKKSNHPIARAAIKLFLHDLYEVDEADDSNRHPDNDPDNPLPFCDFCEYHDHHIEDCPVRKSSLARAIANERAIANILPPSGMTGIQQHGTRGR